MTGSVPFQLGVDHLGIAEVAAVARGRRPVQLAPVAVDRLRRGRALVARAEAEGRPVYGLTRGLGPRVGEAVGSTDQAEFSRLVVLARAAGAGPELPEDAVRAALLARAHGLAQGGAGVRPELVAAQAAMLDRGVHPVVPAIGSAGASDLMLLANLALPLIGEGRARLDGALLPGAAAMAAAGIPTLTLASKEGLALCSANSVSAGFGALVLGDAAALLARLESVVAVTFEAFRANLSPLDPRVTAARPAPGQAEAATALLRLLDGGALTEPGAARRVQDPLSLRCVAPVHGALRHALAFARAPLEIELNGAGDNPLLLDDGQILSTANFHTPALAIGFDALSLALSQVASLSAMRVARLMSGRLTDLPDRLTRAEGAASTGLALLGLTAATLVKEIRRLAQPASLDDHGHQEVEDHAPMTLAAVRGAAQILPLLRQVAACELIAAAQAFELRGIARPSPAAQAVVDGLRAVVPPLDSDRSLAPDIEAAAALLAGASWPVQGESSWIR